MKLRMFEDKNFWKSMLRLALPIAFQNLLTTSLSLVDTLMIGQLGDVSIAAVGIASQVAFFVNIAMFGIASGGAVFIAQYWGRGDRDGISRAYGMMLICNIPIALILSTVVFLFPNSVIGLFSNDQVAIAEGARYIKIACFSYLGVALSQTFSIVLRSTEEVKLPVVSGAVAVVINVILNYVLIFGKFGFPAMGVEGAALATTISGLFSPILMLVISIFKKNVLVPPIRKMFSISKEFVAEFFQRASPVLINETLWALGVMGYNAVFGRMGTGNYSALTIFRTVENISFVFFIGICNACNVMIAKRVGAGDIEEAKQYSKRFLLLVPALAVVVGAMVILLREPILGIFNIASEVHSTASILLLIYGLEMGLRNIPYVSVVGIFRAGGDTKTGMKYDLLSLWLLALPITAVCGLVLDMPFIWVYVIMLLCEDLLKNVLCIRRYLSMKWIQPVKNEGGGDMSRADAV